MDELWVGSRDGRMQRGIQCSLPTYRRYWKTIQNKVQSTKIATCFKTWHFLEFSSKFTPNVYEREQSYSINSRKKKHQLTVKKMIWTEKLLQKEIVDSDKIVTRFPVFATFFSRFFSIMKKTTMKITRTIDLMHQLIAKFVRKMVPRSKIKARCLVKKFSMDGSQIYVEIKHQSCP